MPSGPPAVAIKGPKDRLAWAFVQRFLIADAFASLSMIVERHDLEEKGFMRRSRMGHGPFVTGSLRWRGVYSCDNYLMRRPM